MQGVGTLGNGIAGEHTGAAGTVAESHDGGIQVEVDMLSILLQNAASTSPTKSKIKVFLEKKGDNAELRVADSGIGLPSEAMATLFDETISDDDSLNLHKVFDIIMSHNGTIRTEENQGGGTIFIIEIPCGIEIPVEDAVMMDDEDTSEK